MDAKHGALFGAIMGGLIGLVGGAPGVIVGAVAGAGTGGVAAQLIDLGFPNEYLRDLQDSLQPGSSALVFLIDPIWIDGVVEDLAPWGGRLFRYTLKSELAQVSKWDLGETRGKLKMQRIVKRIAFLTKGKAMFEQQIYGTWDS